MKAKIRIEKEYEVKYLQVNAGVRYWEDSEINGVEDGFGVPQMPCAVRMIYHSRNRSGGGVCSLYAGGL